MWWNIGEETSSIPITLIPKVRDIFPKSSKKETTWTIKKLKDTLKSIEEFHKMQSRVETTNEGWNLNLAHNNKDNNAEIQANYFNKLNFDINTAGIH